MEYFENILSARFHIFQISSTPSCVISFQLIHFSNPIALYLYIHTVRSFDDKCRSRTDIPDDTNYRRKKNLIVATGVSACFNIPFIFLQIVTRHLLHHPFLTKFLTRRIDTLEPMISQKFIENHVAFTIILLKHLFKSYL